MTQKHIAIIGAGFSGTMLTCHLIKHSSHHLIISLFDKSKKFAEGVAYSTINPHHLLNVRAENMSAYPEEPGHLLQWLHTHETTWRALHPEFLTLTLGAKSFVPRMIFGAYIKSLLAEALVAAESKGHVIHCLPYRVDHIDIKDYHCHIQYGKGEKLITDAALLAAGSLAPKAFNYEKKLFHSPERFARNVWNPPYGNILHPANNDKTAADPVVIIGTGLTMVDTALTLHDKGFAGDIISFSRHGHLPAVHQTYPPYPKTWKSEELPSTAFGLLRMCREEIKNATEQGYGWRAVIDSLRPVTNPLWQQLPTREKRLFLKHLASLWNVHRHRMAPESAAILAKMQQSGQLRQLKGSIIDADTEGSHLVISYHERGRPGIQSMQASYLLNCTGSEVDVGKSAPHELLYRLQEAGYVSVGSLRAGLEYKQLHLKGDGSDYLFAVGPLLFGTLFETIAVPELRVQAKELALYLLTFLQERDTNSFTI
jgi:uncharacterized NAD(P)/FAD-binding protein YdhS